MPEYRDETGRVRNRDMEYSFLAAPRPPGGGVPQGGGAQTPGLPPLPTSLSNLQQKAGSRAALDPVALKLGYFPLPFVEKYLAEVVALQQQVQGLQSQLQGLTSRITAANTWVASVVGDVTGFGSGFPSGIAGLTGKTYKGVSFDAFTDIPNDIATLWVQIGSIEGAADPNNTQNFTIPDLFTGRFLTWLKGALATLNKAIADLQAQVNGLTTRLNTGNGVLTGILNNATLLTGNTYTPTSFDSVPLAHIGADLGRLATALGPNGIGGTVSGWTGNPYGPQDILGGRLLGDLKTWVQGSLTNDVVSLNNLTQKVFGLVAQSARDFVGLNQLHGFNTTHQVVKSQDSIDALRPDDYGNMQDNGFGSKGAEQSGFDGWEGDGLNVQANPWQPTQFDAGRDVRRMGVLGFLTSKPFERMRRQRSMDAIPSGINTGDYGHDMIINWGDGSWEHNMSGPTHIFGAGTFTPSIQPLVQDTKTGKWYGGKPPFQDGQGNFLGGIWHNLRTYAFGVFPKSVKRLGNPFVKDAAGNIYNMGYQMFGRSGSPADDGQDVLVTRREKGDASDFVSRHVDHKLVKTQTATVQTGSAGNWSAPQTLSGLVLAEIDPTSYVPHHNYITPLRNPRAVLKEDY